MWQMHQLSLKRRHETEMAACSFPSTFPHRHSHTHTSGKSGAKLPTPKRTFLAESASFFAGGGDIVLPNSRLVTLASKGDLSLENFESSETGFPEAESVS